MEELLAYRQELIAALGSSVEALARVVAGLPYETWHAPSAPEALSPHFILARLRALEGQEFVPLLHRIQKENVPVLEAFDDRAWTAAYYQADEPILKIMSELSRLRAQEVAWLRDLPSSVWSRLGRHRWQGLRSFQWWVEQQLESSCQSAKRLLTFLT